MFIHNSRLYESQMLANDIQEKAQKTLSAHPEYNPVELDGMPHADTYKTYQDSCIQIRFHQLGGTTDLFAIKPLLDRLGSFLKQAPQVSESFLKRFVRSHFDVVVRQQIF